MRITCDDGPSAWATRTRSGPAARPSSRCCAIISRRGSSAAMPRRSRRSGRTSFSPRMRRRSARSPAWRSRRSTPRCGTCDASARASRCGRWRAARRRRCRCTPPKAAGCTIRSSSWSTRRSPRRRKGSKAARSRSASRRSRKTSRGCRRCARAVGDAFEVMVDANQAFTVAEARRRAHAYEPAMLAWFEEPLPAEDLGGHVELASQSPRCRSQSANRCITRRIFANTSSAARVRWCRSTARGSAASRRGSRLRTWRKLSMRRSVHISSWNCTSRCRRPCRTGLGWNTSRSSTPSPRRE